MHPIHNWGLSINQFMLLFPFTQNSGQCPRDVVQHPAAFPSPRSFLLQFRPCNPFPHPNPPNRPPRTPQVASRPLVLLRLLYDLLCFLPLLAFPLKLPPKSPPHISLLAPYSTSYFTTHIYSSTTTHRPRPRTPRVSSAFALASHAQQSLPLSYTCTNLFNGWL